MTNNTADYTFYVADDVSGKLVADSTKRTVKYGITYSDWDYITVQQVSESSGLGHTLTDLQNVIDYINDNKTSEAEILWHMTWAYQQDSTHSGFKNYNSDQMTMYNSIVSLVTDYISTYSDIAGFIPAGTAIQNLRTSHLGDTLTRDGYHMSYGIGRYTVALTWLAYLTGYDIDKITAIPSSYPEIAENIEFIKEAVNNAIKTPTAVTESIKSVNVVVNYVDESGNTLSTQKSLRAVSGRELKLRSPDVSGYYTRDVYLTVTPESDCVINVVYKPVPLNIDDDVIEQYLSDIVAWGDSITAGAGADNITAATEHGIDLVALGSTAAGANYVTVLKNLIARSIYSGIDVACCGIGGEATSTITARADTENYYFYLDGAVTISGSPVTIPLVHYASCGRVGTLRQGGSDHVNPVTIVGKDANGNEISVSGTLTVSLTDDAPAGTDKKTCDAKYLKYTFTRNDGKNDTLSFVSGARVISKASYLYDGRTCIIFMGENGGYSSVAELILQQEEILKACGNPEFYIIISTTSGSYESRTEVRNALAERWGEHYINMGDELNSSRDPYELAGYSEEAISEIYDNIANGTVSTLLIKDSCHPNAVGYAVIGNIIFERLFDLGAFDAIFDYYDSLVA